MFGFTFPLLMFDQVIHILAEKHGLEFLPFRLWIGMWTVFFLLLFLAFGLSVYVRYFTRFTLDIFLFLVAVVMLYSASSSIHEIKLKNPVSTPYFQEHSCFCINTLAERLNNTHHQVVRSTHGFMGNGNSRNTTQSSASAVQYLNVSFVDCISQGGRLEGGGCHTGVYFLSLLLALCTVILVSICAYLRKSGYFPRSVSISILLL